ncbi:hypothetical protein CVT26_015200 [Gymnopilus dilepis]|uniref:Uncharacterized protein n=1 Tax=Gymnopilus dilepis TaxID=231916 RepID=A0A409X713_9AGAR|nr:hypothetical protein CVT26_015200 [Gymnopilus dilepis]
MSAFKYGVEKMEAGGWEERKKTLPVVFANEASAATIRKGEPNIAAIHRVLDSSSRGGVKLLSLAASLYNHFEVT